MKRSIELLISAAGITIIVACLTSAPIVRASTTVSQSGVAQQSTFKQSVAEAP